MKRWIIWSVLTMVLAFSFVTRSVAVRDVRPTTTSSAASLPCDAVVRRLAEKEHVTDVSSKPGFGKGSGSMKHAQAGLVLLGNCADEGGIWMQTIWDRAHPPSSFVEATGRLAATALTLPENAVKQASSACLRKAQRDRVNIGEQPFEGGGIYCETDRLDDHGVMLQVTRQGYKPK